MRRLAVLPLVALVLVPCFLSTVACHERDAGDVPRSEPRQRSAGGWWMLDAEAHASGNERLKRLTEEYTTQHNEVMELLRPFQDAERLPTDQYFDYVHSHGDDLQVVNRQIGDLAERARLLADSMLVYSTPAAAELLAMQAEYLEVVRSRNEGVGRMVSEAMAFREGGASQLAMIQAAQVVEVLNRRLAELQARMEAQYRKVKVDR